MNLMRCVGRVVAIGDGKVKINFELRQMLMVVQPGDVVVFQMNSIQAANSLVLDDQADILTPMGGQPKAQFYILNQGDCIARLTAGTTVKLNTIQMLGTWSLVEPFLEPLKSGLVIPDSIDPIHLGSPRFRLVQKGTHAKLDAEVGQELIVEKALVNRIDFDNKSYGFVEADRVYGVIG